MELLMIMLGSILFVIGVSLLVFGLAAIFFVPLIGIGALLCGAAAVVGGWKLGTNV